METGDLAVHGHEVYPSDVPSLSFPRDRGDSRGAGDHRGHCPRAERLRAAATDQTAEEPSFAGAPRRS